MRDRVQQRDPEVWTKKFRICTVWVTMRAWISETTIINGKSCRELEMRSHLRQESYARCCQKIEELKRRCCQEVNAAKQQKLDELNAKQNQNSFEDQVRRLQERLECMKDSRTFQDPDSPSSYDSTHISHQARMASSSSKPSREPRTRRITRADMSFSGDVHDCKVARCDPDDIRNNSKNFVRSSESLRREGI